MSLRRAAARNEVALRPAELQTTTRREVAGRVAAPLVTRPVDQPPVTEGWWLPLQSPPVATAPPRRRRNIWWPHPISLLGIGPTVGIAVAVLVVDDGPARSGAVGLLWFALVCYLAGVAGNGWERARDDTR